MWRWYCRVSYLNWGDLDCLDEKTLRENPGHEFICISNERYHFSLGNKNKKIGARLYDLEIKGDYYKKLKEFGIGISFKKLLDDKNLHKLDI